MGIYADLGPYSTGWGKEKAFLYFPIIGIINRNWMFRKYVLCLSKHIHFDLEK